MLRTADQCRHAILQRDEGMERREGGEGWFGGGAIEGVIKRRKAVKV